MKRQHTSNSKMPLTPLGRKNTPGCFKFKKRNVEKIQTCGPACSWASLVEQDKVLLALRGVQKRRRCTTAVLDDVRESLAPFLRCKPPPRVASINKRMISASGVELLILHGCTKCKEHVFLPSDKCITCPCGHPRYNKKGKPFKRCFYFPLRPRIKALLGLASFRAKLQHEHRRLSNPQLMSDVYDSPAWKKKMGPCTERLSRIGFQYCADGIPPCSEGRRDTDRQTQTHAQIHHTPPPLTSCDFA
jgi:hypothetical protein